MKICILNLLGDRFDEMSVFRPLGGSETWVVQLAHAFAEYGHAVTVVCACEPHDAADGVRWENFSIRDTEYDVVIASRLVSRSLDFMSASNLRAGEVFVQLHDEYAWGNDIRPSDMTDPRLNALVCLTDWHVAHVAEKCGYAAEIRKIPNGIDISLFPEIDLTREPGHYAVWSSCFERGASIAVDVAARVRSEISDFKVIACSYSGTRHDFSEPWVEFVGALSKRELYAFMSSAGVWFYPSTYSETFCITAIENMYCGNMLVLAPRYGTTEFSRYCVPMSAQFATDDKINFTDPEHYKRSSPSSYAYAVEEAAAGVVKAIKNFDTPESIALRTAAHTAVLEKFTWKAVATQWLSLIAEYNGSVL